MPVFRLLAQIAYWAFATLILLEATLRLFPNVIPFSLLVHFDPDIRVGIARNMSLAVKEDMVPVKRDEGGPALWIFPPHYEYYFPYKDVGSTQSIKLDASGFCNPPHTETDSAQIDIIMLGDSMIWCTAVPPEQTFPAKLFALSGRNGYNLSRHGIGLYEHLQLLKNFGLDKKPHIVILNVYGGNDLRDAERYFSAQVPDDAADQRTRSRHGLIAWFMSHSYALNVVAGVQHYLPAKSEKRRWKILEEQTNFRYSLLDNEESLPFNPGNGDVDEVVLAHQLKTGHIELTLFDDTLSNFRSLADEHGFIPVVTYIPSAFAVYWPDVQFEDEELVELMPWFSKAQQDYLAMMSNKLGLVYLDLTPALREYARQYGLEQPLYYPTNRHFSPLGHEVIARIVAEAIEKLGND